MRELSRMVVYSHPPGVEPLTLQGRPVLTLPRGGRVAIDDSVLSVWTTAAGRTVDDVIHRWPIPSDRARWLPAALACLAEARLLQRDAIDPTVGAAAVPPPPLPASPPLVSAIVISYDSQEWLQGCLGSLAAQRYPAIEPIVIDNASPEDPTPWIAGHFPAVRAVRLPPGRSFAHAVNHGVSLARGRYAFVLNPDIVLHPDATAHAVAAAEASPDAAAVAIKLAFWWAPAFLNGLGNRVESTSWGTDNFIGHLDLGQFDAVTDVPSVCFAAALIRRSAWDAVGPADEAFPMYYEDTEWSYRARLAGYRIAAAPRALVEHVFGGRVRSGAESDLTPFKTKNAAYGRLRFALKLVGGRERRTFVANYLTEDAVNVRAAVKRGDWVTVRAYAAAWLRLGVTAPAIAVARRAIRRTRRLPDAALFAGQQEFPGGLMWHGIPELSRETIATDYLPLLLSGRTRPLPEFSRPPVAAS
jgi:N-acetylglucosaminyl-diphospho-decaprenol L-rhamnosyltransferase